MSKRDRANDITDAIYVRLKDRGIKMPLYPAVLRRVKDLIEQTHDADQVEVVCLKLADLDAAHFSAMTSLNWGSYERFKLALEEEVPEGGWEPYLWAYRLPEGPRKQSADYWLGLWHDAQEAYDQDRQEQAQRGLAALRLNDLDEVTI